jgi:hypothetical protein
MSEYRMQTTTTTTTTTNRNRHLISYISMSLLLLFFSTFSSISNPNPWSLVVSPCLLEAGWSVVSCVSRDKALVPDPLTLTRIHLPRRGYIFIYYLSITTTSDLIPLPSFFELLLLLLLILVRGTIIGK